MSFKVRNYLKEYVASCLDARLGQSTYDSLPPQKQDNIARYVEVRIYNRVRPAGAAPLPRAGDSKECEELLEILKEETNKTKVRLILPEVDLYLKIIDEEGMKVGDELIDEIRLKKKRKILVEAK